MTAAVIALGAYSLVVTLAAWAQRAALQDRAKVIEAYKDEIRRASELMAVMAREDIATKRRGDRPDGGGALR